MRHRVGAWGAELSDDDFACAIAARGVMVPGSPDVDVVHEERVVWRGLAATTGSAAQLADRWRKVVRSVPRLRCVMETTDLEAWPWLARPAVGLAGIVVASHAAAPPSVEPWVWPWRVVDLTARVAPDLRASPWSDRTLNVVSSEEPTPPGLVILDGPLLDAQSLLVGRYPRLRANLALISGGLDATARRSPWLAWSLAEQLHASAVIVGAPRGEDALVRFVEELSIQLSHDSPLDIAVYNAAAMLQIELPILHGDPSFADRCRLSNRATRVIDELVSTGHDDTSDPSLPFGDGGLESLPGSLSTLKDRLVWDREGQGAAVTARLSRLQQRARDDSARRAPSRYLQATLKSDRDEGFAKAVHPDRIYAVAVKIGEFDPEVLSNLSAIDEVYAGADITCDVIVSEPNLLSEPLRGTIVLPPNGNSTDATFYVFTRPGVARLELRIAVLHRGRVLQSGIIRAAIDGADPLVFGFDSVSRHRLSGLEHRRPFDAAFIANHTAAGEPGFLGATDDSVGYIKLDPKALSDLTDALGRSISAIAANPAAHRNLRDKGNVELLRRLARRGARFRLLLTKHNKLGTDLAKAGRIQIVSARVDTFLPLELVYEYPPPDDDAPLCEHAEEGLKTGTCTCTPDSSRICPLGFWSLTRVIERQAHRPAHNELRADFEVMRMEAVTPARAKLGAPKAAVFAASARADVGEPGTIARLKATLVESFGETNVKCAVDWPGWVAGVKEATRPNLLVLLPHHLEGDESEGILEIGDKAQLDALAVSRKYVTGDPPSPSPIVLLLGCATAMAQIPYESFVSIFRDYDAAVVISTISTVLGRDAGPVAESLVRALLAGDGGYVGDAMLKIRRQMLLEGKAMVLALTAYGDADWVLAPSGKEV